MITKSGKCVIYVRTSTLKQNIDNQEMCCKSFAKKAGLEIKAIYHDRGISGTSLHKRNGLKNALESLEKGDILLVREISRSSRDIGDQEYIDDIILGKGAYLVAYLEKIGFEYLPNPSLFNDYNSKSCYIYSYTKNEDIMRRIEKCIDYANSNNMKIIDIVHEEDEDNTDNFENIISKLNPNEFIIVPSLQDIYFGRVELSDFFKDIYKKKAYIRFHSEGLCTTILGIESYINIILFVLEESQRISISSNTDHILHKNNLCKLLSIQDNHKIDESKTPEITGYIYIITKLGFLHIGFGITPLEIYNSPRIHSMKDTIIIYPSNDHESHYSKIIAWCFTKQYIDLDEKEGTLNDKADISEIIDKMSSIIRKEGVSMTVNEIPKKFSDKK